MLENYILKKNHQAGGSCDKFNILYNCVQVEGVLQMGRSLPY